MEVAIITLSITLFFCIIFLGVIVKKYTDLLQKLNETVSNINKEKEKLDKLVEIEPGDSAMADEQKHFKEAKESLKKKPTKKKETV